jgi:hypothetical protein
MSDFVWGKITQSFIDTRLEQLYETKLLPTNELAIHANKGTYNCFKSDNDFVFVLGYCHHPEKTIEQSLQVQDLLISFTELKIGTIKSSYLGQYILIIKKEENLFIFADCMQVRNIFYSTEEKIISSSFNSIENYLGTGLNSLDKYKLFEFLAVGQIMFPGWLGNGTCHKGIKRLRNYEYIKIDLKDKSISIKNIEYKIDNRKVMDMEFLAAELIKNLEKSICQEHLRSENIGATITGGYDSRLVTAIAAKYYEKIQLRIGISSDRPRSINDYKIAQKIAEKYSTRLDVYYKNGTKDEELFFNMTEGFVPNDNSGTTRLIDNTHLYSMGLGGLCGTQLFFPDKFSSGSDFIDFYVSLLKHKFINCDDYIECFYENLKNEFLNLKKQCVFSEDSEQDLLRLFRLHNSLYYGSFIHSAFNIKGIQMEPYLTMPVIETAFKVPDIFKGKKERFGGTNFVQKKAMSLVDYNVGKFMTFSHFEPMLPLSIRTMPLYSMGYFLHVVDWLKIRTMSKKIAPSITNFYGRQYISNGWNSTFIRRIQEKYDTGILFK